MNDLLDRLDANGTGPPQSNPSGAGFSGADPPNAGLDPVWARSPVLTKLQRFNTLSEADCQALMNVTGVRRTVSAHRDLVRDGDRPAGIRFITQGYACQYTVLSDGHRQIMALLLPGDECSSYMAVPAHAHYGICALTEITFAEVSTATLLTLLERHPVIADALWRSTLVNNAILHERITNLGRRSAQKRLAHLLCELFVRSDAVGLANGLQCIVPLSQSDLADLLGLSLVHTNRSLQALRAENLLRLESRLLTILDFPRLQQTAQFDPSYLHLRSDVKVMIPAPHLAMLRRAEPLPLT